jgi:quercetin dioxygenase-like cupin family protein
MGHFLEIENQSFPEYKKGDYAYILKDQVHCVSNISNTNRYTLQVTGFAKTEDLK